MKTARQTPAAYAWILVALLWVVALLNYLDRQVIFSLFPPLQQEFNVSTTQLGLLSTFFLWGLRCNQSLGGFLADRYSRKKIIIVSLAIWSAVTWLPTYLYERFSMSLNGWGFSATFYIQAASFGGIILGGTMVAAAGALKDTIGLGGGLTDFCCDFARGRTGVTSAPTDWHARLKQSLSSADQGWVRNHFVMLDSDGCVP